MVNALEHLRVYHSRIQKAYSKKIKPKQFKVGDLVLKENLTNTKAIENEKKGRFKPNWIGPYIFIANFGKDVYKLSSIDGKEELNPINFMHLKKFYF